MKILLVEDQDDIAEFIKRGLEEAHYHVTVAQNGEAGLDLARVRNYSAIILDIMLPGCDGWNVCTELRDRRVTTPIIMLNARDSVKDRVRGLELGADDYLPKPFDFHELLARVQAAIRRHNVHKGRKLRVGDLELDTRTGTAYRAGARIDMTMREFAVLELLVSREGSVVTRDMLQEQVWSDEPCFSNTIDVHIKNLRKKIDAQSDEKLIHSVYGMGYTLEARPGTDDRTLEDPIT